MRENRPYGSEGGEAKAFPTPIMRRMDCFVAALLAMTIDLPSVSPLFDPRAVAS